MFCGIIICFNFFLFENAFSPNLEIETGIMVFALHVSNSLFLESIIAHELSLESKYGFCGETVMLTRFEFSNTSEVQKRNESDTHKLSKFSHSEKALAKILCNVLGNFTYCKSFIP